MTFDDDFLRIQFQGGTRDIRCKKNGIDWPPPETLTVHGFEFQRESMSPITDKQRERMTHVMRGAIYVPKGE